MRAASAEPDLPRSFVDALHSAHDPLAARDLILHRTGDAVVQVKMTPAVALRHPDDLSTVVHIVTIPASRIGEAAIRGAITEERLRFVGNNGARLAVRVDFDDAINLVSTLIVFKREPAAVFAPNGIGEF